MNTTVGPTTAAGSVPSPTVLAAFRRAAVRASYAPSVHNTQPWRFVVSRRGLDVLADPTRQLHVLDPTRRQLIISVGCAVLNARVSLAGAGLGITTTAAPDPAQPLLLARLAPNGAAADQELAALDRLIELRQTNRRRFADEPVPAELIDVLEQAARAEEAELLHIHRPEQALIIAGLSQHADQEQNANPAYRAELRAWTTSDPTRRDGVPATAVPHVDTGAEDDIPIRDFDTQGTGYLPTNTHSSTRQSLFLLSAAGDGTLDWLRVGQALERILLEVTRHGYVASPLTQIVEVPYTRAVLRQQLQMQSYPDILLRVGRAAATPASRRRRLADVLTELDD